MLIVAVFLLGILVIRLAGGDLRQLNGLSIRWAPIAGVALIAQIAIIAFWPAGWRNGHLIVHLATYAALLTFLYANRRLSWLWVVGVGTIANATAIAANGDVMPASPTALATAARTTGRGFANSIPLAHPRLLWLGDIIPTPSWLPLHNVASVGDLLIVVGAILVVWAAARPRQDRDHGEATSPNTSPPTYDLSDQLCGD